jgi:hypothetical protein
MPGGDRTGPMGMGPMTGRGAGFCAGFPLPGFVNPGFGGAGYGRGWFGRGRGGGRGRRNWFYATGLTGWQRAAMGRPPWAFAAPYGVPFAPGVPGREEETEVLKRQADYLAGALDEVRKRLDELQTQPQGQA